MSRSLTAGVITEVTADKMSPIGLLKVAFDSGNLLLWSGQGNIVYNGDTYTGTGNMVSMTEVNEVTDIQAQGASFQLSGVPASIISDALNEPYQGRLITLYEAFLNSAGAIIVDPYQLFKGRMDVLTIIDGGDTAALSVTAENILIDLNRIKVKRYTMEDQQATYPLDKGLSYITSLQDKEIIWGQKTPAVSS